MIHYRVILRWTQVIFRQSQGNRNWNIKVKMSLPQLLYEAISLSVIGGGYFVPRSDMRGAVSLSQVLCEAISLSVKRGGCFVPRSDTFS